MYTKLYRTLPPEHQLLKTLAHYRRYASPEYAMKFARVMGLWEDDEPTTQRHPQRQIGAALQYAQPQLNTWKSYGATANYGRATGFVPNWGRR